MSLDRLFIVLRMRLRSLFGGNQLDHEMDEELRYHLERQVEANVTRGMTPGAARREALLSLGGIERRKEEIRDTRRVRFVDDMFRDIRYAARTLHRTPAFTLGAVVPLALGIGASVAVFTVVNGVLLRPLPFPEPERLVLVGMMPQSQSTRGPVVSDRSFLALEANKTIFKDVASFSASELSLTGSGDPALIKVASVTSGFFATLGVPPAMGRVFDSSEPPNEAEPAIVLSDRLWRTRFAADRSILGQGLRIDGVQHVVIGVMPPGFDFPETSMAWRPRAVRIQRGNSLAFPVFARLEPRLTFEQAQAAFDTVSQQLPDDPGLDRASWTIGLFRLEDLVVGQIRQPLLIFSGAVLFVLLIACGNVAHLLLARAWNRQQEIAVRAAIGASRGRLIRQLLTESVLLASFGGGLAVLLASWLVPALLALAPEGRVPRQELIKIDGWVVAFAFGLSLSTGLLFGLAPALRATRRSSAGAGSSARTFGAGQERLRAALVIGEIALSLVLLTGAGLMIKSFLRLQAVDSGFDAANAITLNLDLPASMYGKVESAHAFHDDLLTRLGAVPGVVSAGSVNWRPLGNMHLSGDWYVEGSGSNAEGEADKPTVSGGYFRAMGITLLRGRDFNASDNDSGLPVAIVSRSVARAIAPTEDVIGTRISLRQNPRPEEWLTIVGVVNDVRQWGPSAEARPAIYQPYRQVRQPMLLTHMTYVVRTAADPQRALPAIREALRAVDRDQPASIVLMSDVMALATAEPRFHARLLGAFAFVALLLALVGTYGVLAYSVAQRTHEIGVRVALGAQTRSILWMVFRRTLMLTGYGVALGIAGAALATRVLTTFLFETRPTDPATFAAVAAAITVAALAAGFVPARRATRVDALVALRHE